MVKGLSGYFIYVFVSKLSSFSKLKLRFCQT